MKYTKPLNILTTTIGLLFMHMSIADDTKPPARFYDRKDLPELSEKMIPEQKNREKTKESFDIDRDALFHDEDENSIQFEVHQINNVSNNSLSINITGYPVILDNIDAENNCINLAKTIC